MWNIIGEFLWTSSLIKGLLYVLVFGFATSYLIPHGIVCFLKWKETKQLTKLSMSISFLSGGILIWIYFLSLFLFKSIKNTF